MDRRDFLKNILGGGAALAVGATVAASPAIITAVDPGWLAWVKNGCKKRFWSGIGESKKYPELIFTSNPDPLNQLPRIGWRTGPDLNVIANPEYSDRLKNPFPKEMLGKWVGDESFGNINDKVGVKASVKLLKDTMDRQANIQRFSSFQKIDFSGCNDLVEMKCHDFDLSSLDVSVMESLIPIEGMKTPVDHHLDAIKYIIPSNNEAFAKWLGDPNVVGFKVKGNGKREPVYHKDMYHHKADEPPKFNSVLKNGFLVHPEAAKELDKVIMELDAEGVADGKINYGT